jgi:hypothetical protein
MPARTSAPGPCGRVGENHRDLEADLRIRGGACSRDLDGTGLRLLRALIALAWRVSTDVVPAGVDDRFPFQRAGDEIAPKSVAGDWGTQPRTLRVTSKLSSAPAGLSASCRSEGLFLDVGWGRTGKKRRDGRPIRTSRIVLLKELLLLTVFTKLCNSCVHGMVEAGKMHCSWGPLPR